MGSSIIASYSNSPWIKHGALSFVFVTLLQWIWCWSQRGEIVLASMHDDSRALISGEHSNIHHKWCQDGNLFLELVSSGMLIVGDQIRGAPLAFTRPRRRKIRSTGFFRECGGRFEWVLRHSGFHSPSDRLLILLDFSRWKRHLWNPPYERHDV